MASISDPFEIRVRFSGMLQHMNASHNSAQKAAQFALKYPTLSDDLHSCILEQLEKGNTNTRANIMHFIESFLEQARKENQKPFIHLLQRDIPKIVDTVTPADGSGYINVKTMRTILKSLNLKGFLGEDALALFVSQLDEQERSNWKRLDASLAQIPCTTSAQGSGMGSVVRRDPPPAPVPEVAGDSSAVSGSLSEGPASQEQEVLPLLQQQHNPRTATGLDPLPHLPPTDRQRRLVAERIEEDRERHKRLRESIWAKGYAEEKEDLWENGSDFGDDDERLCGEEGDERGRGWGEECRHLREREKKEEEKAREEEEGRRGSGRDGDGDRDRGKEGEDVKMGGVENGYGEGVNGRNGVEGGEARATPRREHLG